MTTTPCTPQQVLLAAADLMEKRGKAIGHYWDATGRCCALGAISIAASDWQAYDAAKELLHKHIDEDLAISTWSDANDAATVIAALRRAGGA